MKLYNSIQNVLSRKGINLLVDDTYVQQDIWESWYKGSVKDFHFYNAKVMGKNVIKERLTTNMAKKSCEDLTKLLWTEKTKIELDNEDSTKFLWDVLDSKENSFTVNFAQWLEKSIALGTGALIEYKDEYDKTIIDYVLGNSIIPYKYTNGYIYGLVTVSRFTEIERRQNVYYTHITYHEYEKGIYRKLNELYKSKNENELGKEIPFNDKFPNVKEKDEIETDTPAFQIYKNNIANNYNLNSPMSISLFANSIDRLKAIDLKYDSFNREFKVGKKRILVDPTAMRSKMEANSSGEITSVLYIDSDDEAYVGINGMEGQPVKDIDFNLRATEHIDAINAELSWFSSNIGLGNNYYKFDGKSVKTATEVISEDSDAFRTREHYLTILNDVVYDLVKVICEFNKISYSSITIIPDDSVVEDKGTKQIRAMQEVSQGLMSKKTYLTNIKGMSEEMADKELQIILEERNSNYAGEEPGFIE